MLSICRAPDDELYTWSWWFQELSLGHRFQQLGPVILGELVASGFTSRTIARVTEP